MLLFGSCAVTEGNHELAMAHHHGAVMAHGAAMAHHHGAAMAYGAAMAHHHGAAMAHGEAMHSIPPCPWGSHDGTSP